MTSSNKTTNTTAIQKTIPTTIPRNEKVLALSEALNAPTLLFAACLSWVFFDQCKAISPIGKNITVAIIDRRRWSSGQANVGFFAICNSTRAGSDLRLGNSGACRTMSGWPSVSFKNCEYLNNAIVVLLVFRGTNQPTSCNSQTIITYGWWRSPYLQGPIARTYVDQ